MEKPEKITTAFLWNNDPEEVNQSLKKIFSMVEKQGENLYPPEWSKQRFHITEIGFLLTGLATVRKKVVDAFNATLKGKSPEDLQKEIIELNRAFYCSGEDYTN